MAMEGYERRVKIEDGKVVSFYYAPNEALRQQKRFAKTMNDQKWMPESTMKQILEAYNEAFNNEMAINSRY